MSDDRFVFVDIETTGLVPDREIVLEVGFCIVTTDLTNVIADCSQLIWDSGYTEFVENMTDAYVADMHTKSGLFVDARRDGVPLQQAQDQLVAWLNEWGMSKDTPIKARDPLAGSSVHFDRSMLIEHLPQVEECFHYRNIDISTIKELCRRLNPEVYAKLDKATEKQELHRVQPDLIDTLKEFRFYRDNFVFATV